MWSLLCPLKAKEMFLVLMRGRGSSQKYEEDNQRQWKETKRKQILSFREKKNKQGKYVK